MKVAPGSREITIIPAEPGWSVLEVGRDPVDDAQIVVHQCVVTWRLITEVLADRQNRGAITTKTQPIIVNDPNFLKSDGIPDFSLRLRDPAGRIFDSVRSYNSDAEWLAEWAAAEVESLNRLLANQVGERQPEA